MIEHKLRSDPRPLALIREHYDIEKGLAARLRTSTAAERGRLYGVVYDELYRRVPHHPQLSRKASAEETRGIVARQVAFLRKFVRKGSTFLEVGCGDCALSFAIAGSVRKVLAVDVSAEITASAATPPNFELVISDGTSIPVAPGSADLVYSNQLMEHLHPDDVRTQLVNLYRALAPGGTYVCITPNRLIGPHDVSRWFDREATGMHLREYTNLDLSSMFRDVGFCSVRIYTSVRGRTFRVPSALVTLIERTVLALPQALGDALSRTFLVSGLLRNCRVIAIKPD